MTLEAVPLSGAMGAEIRGADLRDVDDETFAAIHDILLDHGMIYFRDQDITPAWKIVISLIVFCLVCLHYQNISTRTSSIYIILYVPLTSICSHSCWNTPTSTGGGYFSIVMSYYSSSTNWTD